VGRDNLTGGLQELLDLIRRQVFAGAPIQIRLYSWGIEEGEGIDRDLGAEAFLLCRLWASFPFSSIGASFRAFLSFEVWPDFLAAFAMLQIIAPAYLSHYRPFMVKVVTDPRGWLNARFLDSQRASPPATQSSSCIHQQFGKKSRIRSKQSLAP
jgi:hypothetical protein